ncbi:MAG: 7TM diverse intracellular signaling domain-containing protein [Desulfitobacteriia bacterium]
MKKLFISLAAILIGFFTVSLVLNGQPDLPKAANKPQAVNGILDLADWNWEQDGIILLDGQWEFYWQELLSPEDFTNTADLTTENQIAVPRAWNKYKIDGQELSGQGYATYRLRIYSPGQQILGLKIPRIFTSYKLWANGQLLASAGKVAVNKEQMVPQYLPQVAYLQPTDGTIELVVQVANFRHRSGGILESLYLGSQGQITQLRNNNLALELFLFGSLFIIGLYHLGLFAFRTKDRSTLYFGIYTLMIACRTLLVGEIYFINLFPDFSWEIAHKIQTTAFYVGIPLFFMFLKTIFPQDIRPRLNRLIYIVGFAFGLLVLLTPARIFTPFNPAYQLFFLLVVPAYILYLVVVTCWRKREGAYLIGIGVTILLFCAVNDIIFLSIFLNDTEAHFLRSIVTRGNLSSWGLLILVFAQSLVLAQKLSQSFSKTELVTAELRRLNDSLEEKVQERTQALETSNKELEKAYAAASRSEKSRQFLVQNISHDLRTPLTSIKGYVDTILDGIVRDPEQQKKYLARVAEKVISINHLVEQLTELARLESRQSQLHFKSVPLIKYLEAICEQYTLDFQASTVELQIRFPEDLMNHPGIYRRSLSQH